MRFTEVHFKKFSVEPDTIFSTLPEYSPPFWPIDWDIAVIQTLEAESIYEWAKGKLVGKMDVFNSYDGNILVGFSDPTDMLLFKISYVPPTTESFL